MYFVYQHNVNATSFSIKLHSETKFPAVWACLGVDPLDMPRTLPSHHYLYIIHLINCLQRFYCITMSLKRPFVPIWAIIRVKNGIHLFEGYFSPSNNQHRMCRHCDVHYDVFFPHDVMFCGPFSPDDIKDHYHCVPPALLTDRNNLNIQQL